MGELNRPDRGYKNGGKVARGCGAIMSKEKRKRGWYNVTFSNPDPIGDFEKKVRSKKRKN